MHVHGGDDLEIVDEDDGVHTGLADVARDLSADEVEGGLVVALTEPEMAGVGAVAGLCLGEVRDLGGRIVGVASTPRTVLERDFFAVVSVRKVSRLTERAMSSKAVISREKMRTSLPCCAS